MRDREIQKVTGDKKQCPQSECVRHPEAVGLHQETSGQAGTIFLGSLVWV